MSPRELIAAADAAPYHVKKNKPQRRLAGGRSAGVKRGGWRQRPPLRMTSRLYSPAPIR
jgi:hypothetical protein